MTLIIGGAYQGKLAFAQETFCLGQEDVFTCDGAHIDFRRSFRTFSAPNLHIIRGFIFCVKNVRFSGKLNENYFSVSSRYFLNRNATQSASVVPFTGSPYAAITARSLS